MQTKKLFDWDWPLASLFDSFVAMLQLAKTLTMLAYVTFFILFPCDLNFFSQFKYPPGYLSDLSLWKWALMKGGIGWAAASPCLARCAATTAT
jgi:hypothetical protein